MALILVRPCHHRRKTMERIFRLSHTLLKIAGCVMISILSISACATIPDKKDITVDKTRFSYSIRGTGGPAVVFESGLGAGMDSWAPVFDKAAAFTTTFTYDRRGYGESGKPASSHKSSAAEEAVKTAGEVALDAVVPVVSTAITLGGIAARASDSSAPRTGAAVVADLHDLLKETGLKPPYVLVGHSLGGLYMMLYARTFPEEVAGLILVDSMHPEQIERCKEFLPAKECDPDFYPWWVKMLIKISPAVVRAEMSGMKETGRQIRSAGIFSAFPLVVISHGKPPADEPGSGKMWAALQQDLVDESQGNIHIIAKKSGHNIQSDEPDLILQAIKDIVLQTRHGDGSLP